MNTLAERVRRIQRDQMMKEQQNCNNETFKFLKSMCFKRCLIYNQNVG